MTDWRDVYMRRYYTSRLGWRGGTEEFFSLLAGYIKPGSAVLELGAGPDNQASAWLADRAGRLDGLDVDPAVASNPHLESAMVYDGRDWPIADAQYDTVVCNYVLEHVIDPQRLADEVARVLRPGGAFVFRTPNAWNYVSLIARLTPHWVHEKIANRVRALDDEASDPYPTVYRMNTAGSLRRVLGSAGLVEERLYAIEKQPSYGMFHPLAFLTLMLFERFVNASPDLGFLRSNWLGAFLRPAR